VAGNGQRGYSGEGVLATAAALNGSYSVAVDAAGSLYIADSGNGRVCRVTPAGIITTAAVLKGPYGVAVDATGNLYVADQDSNRIWKVTPTAITAVAGNGQVGSSGDGGPATAASLNGPWGVAVDAAGNLYIADTYNSRVRKVTPAGTITRVAGGGSAYPGDGGPAIAGSLTLPRGAAVDAVGNLYIADTGNNRVTRVTSAGTIGTLAGTGQGESYYGDGGPAITAALSGPLGVAVDAAGNLYIADTANSRIRSVTPAGTITGMAGNGRNDYSGDGGPATRAALNGPSSVAVDAAGNVYIADRDNHRIRQVSPAGAITTVAGNGQKGYSGDGGPATAAVLNSPYGVAVTSGVLLIADTGNNRIRRVTQAGTITTVAGNGQADYSGDGGPAIAASLRGASGVTVDAASNLYIADSYNNRIRKVTSAGTITTVAGNGQSGYSGDGGPATAASLAVPYGVAADAGGNLYVADTGNHRIRKVLAAAPALSASRQTLAFSAPAGAAGDAAQQIVIGSSAAGLPWQATARTSTGGNWLSMSPTSGRAPSAIAVSVDATDLVPGTYQGAIDIFAPAASPQTISVAVTLTVTAAVPPNLSAEPASLTFQAQVGASPPEQTLHIGNAGGGTLNWSAAVATATGNWLKLGASVGVTPESLAVRSDVTGLAAGNYSGTITIRSGDTGQTLTIPVTLQISAAVGVMLLSQTSMSFRAVEGEGAEPPQTFAVLNVGSGSFYWIAESTVSWLRVSPNSGDSVAGTARIALNTVSVDATGMPAGLYIGFVRIRSTTVNNSPQQMRVDFRVLPAGTKLGAVVRPTGLIFVGVAGGSSPGSQDVSVATTEKIPVLFDSQVQGGDWIVRVPDKGAASADSAGRIVVQPYLGKASLGPNIAFLNVLTRTADDAQVDPVKVLFLVLPAGTVAPTALGDSDGAADSGVPCTSSSLQLQFTSIFPNFSAAMGWGTPILANARDNCGTPAAGGTAWLSFTNSDPPLELKDLKDGRYLEAWRPGKDNPSAVTVTARVRWRGLEAEAKATATVGPNPNPKGLLSQGGVLLAASYRSGPVAPGSIVSLFGQNFTASATTSHSAVSLPLPTKLGGVRVLIGEKEAPLFYVGSGQVNAQVPAELPADRRLQVQVETDGVASAPEPLQTVTNQPGVFTLDPKYGKQQGAILVANTDRLAMRQTPGVPSEPVGRGGYISIFCTGLGATDPPVPSGQAGPSSGPPALVKLPVSVTIGAQSAAVSFAGLAPGLVGVYQVNALVPAGVTPGDEVPVVITQGGAQSNTVTIAVR
jgi:uncharacterized protein (TIGR03437 family)